MFVVPTVRSQSLKGSGLALLIVPDSAAACGAGSGLVIGSG